MIKAGFQEELDFNNSELSFGNHSKYYSFDSSENQNNFTNQPILKETKFIDTSSL